jgi:death-on-curing protein
VTDWRWLSLDVIFAIHERQLSEHGGLDGVRDRGVIESALERPKNQHSYSKPDAADLAAAYAFGLSRNHGFMDGNKRTAWVAARLFLADNGLRLRFERTEAVLTMQALASGTLEEQELAAWFRSRLVSKPL